MILYRAGRPLGEGVAFAAIEQRQVPARRPRERPRHCQLDERDAQ